MSSHTRRDALRLLGAVGTLAALPAGAATQAVRPCRVRTITYGLPVQGAPGVDTLEPALAALAAAKRRFEAEGYEVQTTRITTPPLVARATSTQRAEWLPRLVDLDARVTQAGVRLAIGSLSAGDVDDEALPAWAASLLARTRSLSCSIAVATPEAGALPRAAALAARTMAALARASADGFCNFRFAAIANVPARTPFFPAGWHAGPASFSLGLESAGLVGETLLGVADPAEATRRVRSALNAACSDVERIAREAAREAGVEYAGIDASPAPSPDRSIAAALEPLVGDAFGSVGTLEACGAVTAALRSLDVRTCGYSGLMLPPLEDPHLALRVGEGRVSVRDLLLYSSVCGTGIDCVPLPIDTPTERLAKLVRDVAALAARWNKALSARVMLVPGKQAGEVATFDDPFLAPCRVMAV